MKIKMLIATHKLYQMPQDPIYLPVYAGDPEQNLMNYEDGTSGENISGMNDKYCELTRAYWAWKNLDSDVIGLCQYRRHFTLTSPMNRMRKDKFNFVLTKDQIEMILSDHDLILPKPRRLYIETVGSHFLHAHGDDAFNIMKEAVEYLYPHYSKAFHKVMQRSYGHFNNMFVMKRKYFDAYCEWLFPILFRFVEHVDFSDYNEQQTRVPAYAAERLLDVWIEHNALKYREVPILYMEKQKLMSKIYGFLKRKYFATIE